MGKKQLQQIAERCQQGDREAFALLYTAMRQPLRTICLGYVHNEDVADDLLHDAFLLIFLQIGQLKDIARAEAWMTMLTRRVSLLYLRRQRQRRQEPLSASVATAQQSLAVGNPAEASLGMQEILAAVDALPEGYRRVFRLFVLEDMTHQEIAALLHIDPHSSASQLFHAKALLRRWLRPMALLMLAAALPVGVWYWHGSVGRKGEMTATVEEHHSNRSSNKPALAGTDSCVCPPPTDICRQTHDDGERQLSEGKQQSTEGEQQSSEGERQSTSVPADTCGQIQEYVPTRRNGSGRQLQEHIPMRRSDGNGWLLAVTYSGMGNSRDMRLPYADAETNPVVYDSVAHHHRPLTVALMLNRRLGDGHWMLGAGLSYQRMTSDMLSGNTYVTLSQHQVVQYVGLPVSLSWHYPLGRRFSTYLSLSTAVSLPLRSTLESVYIIDGQSYEPATERLHPAVQWSAGMGIGLQFNLTPHVGFFAEPGLHYHFNNGNDDVKTWDTEHPLDFNIPLGLRISF